MCAQACDTQLLRDVTRKKSDHEPVELSQQRRGERKGRLSVATGQSYCVPANHSDTHEQFTAGKVSSSRPFTSRIQRHTVDHLNNRKVPEREDGRQEALGEGPYAMKNLAKHERIMRNLA